MKGYGGPPFSVEQRKWIFQTWSSAEGTSKDRHYQVQLAFCDRYPGRQPPSLETCYSIGKLYRDTGAFVRRKQRIWSVEEKNLRKEKKAMAIAATVDPYDSWFEKRLRDFVAKSHHPGKRICNGCKETFKRDVSFHTHEPCCRKRFRCETCEMSIYSYRELERHECLNHSCDYCPLKVATTKLLYKHITEEHFSKPQEAKKSEVVEVDSDATSHSSSDSAESESDTTEEEEDLPDVIEEKDETQPQSSRSNSAKTDSARKSTDSVPEVVEEEISNANENDVEMASQPDKSDATGGESDREETETPPIVQRRSQRGKKRKRKDVVAKVVAKEKTAETIARDRRMKKRSKSKSLLDDNSERSCKKQKKKKVDKTAEKDGDYDDATISNGDSSSLSDEADLEDKESTSHYSPKYLQRARHLTKEQRIFIFLRWCAADGCGSMRKRHERVCKDFVAKFPDETPPALMTCYNVAKLFKETGSVEAPPSKRFKPKTESKVDEEVVKLDEGKATPVEVNETAIGTAQNCQMSTESAKLNNDDLTAIDAIDSWFSKSVENVKKEETSSTESGKLNLNDGIAIDNSPFQSAVTVKLEEPSSYGDVNEVPINNVEMRSLSERPAEPKKNITVVAAKPVLNSAENPESVNACGDCGKLFFSQKELHAHWRICKPNQSRVANGVSAGITAKIIVSATAEKATEDQTGPGPSSSNRRKQNFVVMDPQKTYLVSMKNSQGQSVPMKLTLKSNQSPATACAKCQKIFFTKEQLNRHSPCHDDAIRATTMFRCSTCNQDFLSLREREFHEEKHHSVASYLSSVMQPSSSGNGNRSANNTANGGKKGSLNPEPKNLSEDPDRSRLAASYGFRRHQQSWSESVAMSREEKLDETVTQVSSQPVAEPIVVWSCGKCDLIMPESLRNRHEQLCQTQSPLGNMEKQIGKMSHKCRHCNGTFSSSQFLNWHLRTKHGDFRDSSTGIAEVQECHVCAKLFTTEASLDQHLAAAHNLERIVPSTQVLAATRTKCLYCPGFCSAGKLEQHEKMCRAIKNRCPRCGKAFDHWRDPQEALKDHILVWHRRHLCITCHREFDKAEDLCIHEFQCLVDASTPCPSSMAVSCQRCPMKFPSHNECRRHQCLMAIKKTSCLGGAVKQRQEPQAKGISSYRCQDCPKQLENLNKLNEHKNMCHRVVCHNCTEIFTSNESLRLHEAECQDEMNIFAATTAQTCQLCKMEFHSTEDYSRHKCQEETVVVKVESRSPTPPSQPQQVKNVEVNVDPNQFQQEVQPSGPIVLKIAPRTRYVCNLCQAEFASNFGLNHHRQSSHPS